MIFQTRDGAKLNYVFNKKQSPAIVVVPGILQKAQDYSAFQTLPNSLLLIDPRGQGNSTYTKPIPPSTVPMDLTLLQLATDIFDIILQCELKEFILVGFDLSGISCLQLSLLLRGRDDVVLKGLFLANTFPMTPSRGMLRVSMESPQQYLSNSKGKAEVRPLDQLVLREQLNCINGVNLTDQLHLIKTPTLVIHGAENKMIDVSYALMIAENIAGADIIVSPGVGHWYHLQDFNGLLSNLKTFVNKLVFIQTLVGNTSGAARGPRVDIAIIALCCLSVLAYFGVIVRNIFARRISGKKWTPVDNICVLCILANLFRMIEVVNVGSIATRNITQMTDFEIKQYVQVNIFTEFVYFAAGAVGSNIFLVCIASATTGVSLYADMKIGDKIVSPEKILKVIRLIVFLITITISTMWATVGLNNDREAYIHLRRWQYIFPMFTIGCISLPVVLFFGNKVLQVFSEGKTTSRGKSGSLPKNSTEDSATATSEKDNTKNKFVKTRLERIAIFKLGLHMMVTLFYAFTFVNNLMLIVGFEVEFFQTNIAAGVALKIISDISVWVTMGFMFIYMFKMN
ncbi:hypothetical protein HDV06_005380 [Boothiomyces sp. JEL0866]|nr:hypothetical protein HDV06_005380 [Boothiomyces sp. JEL0866]